MTNNISITGLGSGMDTASIVDALVKAQGAPIDRLSSQVSVVNAQKNTLSTLATHLTTLASKADAMKSAVNLRSNVATSTDTSAVSVAVSGSARAGAFDVVVDQLAMSHRSYSNVVTARDQGGLFGAGSISVQVGSGAAVVVDVTATTTLDDLAASLDNIAGLDASVIYDGSQYRLQVSGTQTGAANAVTLSESGTTLGLADPANLRQAAQNSEFSIDGIDMTRSTNLVDDAFAGVSLSLTKASATPVTINITSDSTGMQTKMKELVEAYNTVVRTIRSQTAVVGANNAGKLSGDSTLASLQRGLSGMMSKQVGAGVFQSFAELGVATQRDGTLTLDSAKLEQALTTNRDAVTSLVASNSTTSYVGLAESLSVLAKDYGGVTGILRSRTTAMDTRIRDMNTQMRQMQARLDAYEQQLNARFAAMESQVNVWKATSSSLSIATNSNNSK